MPTWGLPVGDGQKRTRTSAGVVDTREAYRAARSVESDDRVDQTVLPGVGTGDGIDSYLS